MRYNSHTESVADGHLKISTEPGDINGNNPISPRNFILQKAPEGDWVATTRLKAPLKHRWQLAGLMMYGDDNNYVKADVVAYNAPGAALDLRAELAAEKNAAGVSGGDQLNIADSSESGYWYVRVTKVGTSVHGRGQRRRRRLAGDRRRHHLRRSAARARRDGDRAGAGGAGHGGVRLLPPRRRRGPDRHDRAGHHTASPGHRPAAPDGQNGWFVTAPGFTLGATDEGLDGGRDRVPHRCRHVDGVHRTGQPDR